MKMEKEIESILRSYLFGPLNDYGNVISEDDIPRIVNKIIKKYRNQPLPETESNSAEEILTELEHYNPYPSSVFTPIKAKELNKIIKLLRDNGYSTDCLYGNWGRRVWDNCVLKAKELFEEYDHSHQMPSDEDIEKYFTSQHYDNKNGNHYRINKDRIFGAKAMRDGKINNQIT